MATIEELLNSKYLMNTYEEIPLKRVGNHWENEYEESLTCYEDDILKFRDNYSVTTKEVYDQYTKECKDVCNFPIELDWKDWKEIREVLVRNNNYSVERLLEQIDRWE